MLLKMAFSYLLYINTIRNKTMAKYYKFVQPKIVKTSEYEQLIPEQRNKYMVNFNIVDLPYFREHFILSEQNGMFFLAQEDGRDFELERSSDKEVMDVPRVYVQITPEFIDDETAFMNFFIEAASDNYIYLSGTEDFVPGKDFLINETLYEFLDKKYRHPKSPSYIEDLEIETEGFVIGNYVDEDIEVTVWFSQLSEQEEDYNNLEYYFNKNKVEDGVFNEDELNNFYMTFCKAILQFTTISDETRNEPKNQIYDQVLNYFANGMTDCASVGINLILGSTYGKTSTTMQSACSCNSSVTETYNTQTCADMYEQAMKLYLKQMLGDKEFYDDWMNLELGAETMPNSALTGYLKTLIYEFLSYAKDFNIYNTNSNLKHGCCPQAPTSSSSCVVETPLLNYVKILDWVENKELPANVNKTKVYGEAFGELLPSLRI